TGIKFGEFHRVAKIAANIWDHIYSQKSHTKDMTSNQSSKKKIKLGIKEKIPSKLETGKALMSQLINYKGNQDPYNIPYDPNLINIQRQRKDTTENDENSDSDVDSDDSIELEFSLEALKESAERIFEDKCKVITQIVEIMCELKKHKFPKIGGIFIDPDTQEFTVAAIKKEIKYIKTAHTQEKQEKWTPVYEILAELVPNFFSKDDKERFVPTHGDLHPTNIVMEGTKITGNPFASTTEEEIKEHEELQKFFREQMKNFDPEFVGIMDNMDEFKSKIYNLVFIRNAINLNQGKKSIQDILNKSHRTEREVKFTLSKLRRLILDEGIPEENLPKLSPSIQNLIRPDSLRSTVWKRLLGVYHVSASDYVRLIKKGKSCVYEKIRSDTFRTMATDQKFLERVNEEMLTRLLNATAWKMKVSGNQSISYVQGMNVLAAPFLYTMSELDAYCSFVTFIQTCCPLYVTPNLQGLLEKCLKILDVKLFNYLKSKNLTAIIYALPSVLTFCACTPSLDELLKLWDFLFAYGVHLNILCIIAQLVLIRDQLLEAPSPMKLLRTMPKLDAKSIINLTVEFVQKIPNDLYDLLVRHPFDSTVESLVID
ncbi:692_t:CDS:10, partial [Entrophospora sp. SA101]